MPDVPQLFARFDSDAGTDGAARDRYQTFITDLVKTRHPDATTVAGPGNRDWGIDTFVGQMAGGSIRIWQSKYILDWQDAVPQGQVRESFKSAINNASKYGYSISAWTLAVPCVLAPEQMQWFSGWAKRESAKTGVAIDLWDGTELRGQLMTRDAEHVRREYFPHTLSESRSAPPSPEQVARLEDPSQFESALFVRQLQEAGRSETDSACAQFFATDALLRDLEARGQGDAVASMELLHLEVHHVWENRFNDLSPAADPHGRMANLINAVEEGAAACEDPPGLKLASAHKRGTAHRLVEQRKAGWVLHWRNIAASHLLKSGTPADAPAVAVVDVLRTDISSEVIVDV